MHTSIDYLLTSAPSRMQRDFSAYGIWGTTIMSLLGAKDRTVHEIIDLTTLRAEDHIWPAVRVLQHAGFISADTSDLKGNYHLTLTENGRAYLRSLS